MATISRPIGPSDFEHYYGVVTMRLAYLLSKKTSEEFSLLSTRSRVHWLNKATKLACGLFNDEAVVQQLPLLAKNLKERI